MFYKLLPRLPEANALMSKGKVEIWIALIYGDLQSVVWQEFFFTKLEMCLIIIEIYCPVIVSHGHIVNISYTKLLPTFYRIGLVTHIFLRQMGHPWLRENIVTYIAYTYYSNCDRRNGTQRTFLRINIPDIKVLGGGGGGIWPRWAPCCMVAPWTLLSGMFSLKTKHRQNHIWASDQDTFKWLSYTSLVTEILF